MLARLKDLGGSRDSFVVGAVPGDARSVLDIGSGEGWTLAALSWVPRRVGVDTDRSIVARARAMYSNCEFLEVDGALLPFADGSFDAVILSEVIEHVGDVNKKAVVDEAIRVLRPAGVFVLTAPHDGVLAALDPLDFKRRLPRLYAAYRRIRPGAPLTPADIGHKHVTLTELTGLFDRRLTVELVRYGGPLAPAADLLLIVAGILPMVGPRARGLAGRLYSWQSGVPAPEWLATTIRVVGRRVEVRSGE